MQKNFDYDCIIIGAGIAGLSYAFKLKQQGLNFLIVEKSNSIGGNWHSHEYKSSIYEFGPNTLMDVCDELMEMIRIIGFEDQVLKKNTKDSTRHLYLKNKLIEVSTHPLKFLFSDLLSIKAKFRLLLEPFKHKQNPQQEETVHEFARRKFGEEFATNIIATALQGIWAGDSKLLSARSILGALYKLDEEYGSIFAGIYNNIRKNPKKKIRTFSTLSKISFKKGLQSFSYALADYLGRENIILNAKSKITKKANGYEIDISTNGNNLRLNPSKLVIASKSFEAAELLQNSSLKLYEGLNRIYYAPIFLAAFSLKANYFSTQQKKLFNSFGFIDPKPDHLQLGTIFASELFDARKLDDEFLLLSFAGGTRNAQILDFADADIVETLIEELSSILGPYSTVALDKDAFTLINSMRIEKAMPQYNLGHEKIIQSIQEELKNQPGLDLIGNYLAGISVPDTIRYSFGRANEINSSGLRVKGSGEMPGAPSPEHL